MTDTKLTKTKKKAKTKNTSDVMGSISKYITQAISDADQEAATRRVAKLQEAQPELTIDELVDVLIKQKCLQTGAVGAVTSASAMIPGLGTLASLTFGVAADIGWTFKYQAELVLEIAATYGHELTDDEKQRIVMLITGISAGVNQAAQVAGTRIAQKTTEKLAEKSILKGLPIVGVAASAGINIATTYIIGRRAKAYFALGPEAMEDFAEIARTITGVDERVIVEWLVGTTERSWDLATSGAQSAAGAVVIAGKSTGEVIVISAGKVAEIAGGASKGTIRGISSATGTVVEVSKRAGLNVANMANAAGKSTVETGKWVAEGVTSGAIAVADTIARAGRAAASGVSTGVGKTGEFAGAVKDSAISGVGTVAGSVVETGKKTGKAIASGAGKAGRSVGGLVKRAKTAEDEEKEPDKEES